MDSNRTTTQNRPRARPPSGARRKLMAPRRPRDAGPSSRSALADARCRPDARGHPRPRDRPRDAARPHGRGRCAVQPRRGDGEPRRRPNSDTARSASPTFSAATRPRARAAAVLDALCAARARRPSSRPAASGRRARQARRARTPTARRHARPPRGSISSPSSGARTEP